MSRMPGVAMAILRAAALALVAASLPAAAQSALHPGFSKLPPDATIVLMPMDVELFSISGGGVTEPQAEWTRNAVENLKSAFAARKDTLKVRFVELAGEPDDAIEDLNRLHGAVGAAINLHYLGEYKLPTKEGRLDWSLGPDVAVLRERSGADYALFIYMRDGYATGERIGTMIVAALFGVGLPGGFQAGYASLVDLRSGDILWFNRLVRFSGDLRQRDKAGETLDALLAGFPR